MRRLIHYTLIQILLIVFMLPAHANLQDPFTFTPLVTNASEATLFVHVPSGYHLYKNKLKVESSQSHTFSATLPEAELIHDAFLGDQAVYREDFEIELTFTPPPDTTHETLIVSYQGCKGTTLCLPPTQKPLTLSFDQPIAPTSMTEPLKDSHLIGFWAFVLMGILLCLTPCVFPLLPVMSSLLLGTPPPSKQRAIILISLFSLCNTVVYALLGLGTAALGAYFQAWLTQPFVIILSASVLIILALSLFNIFRFPSYQLTIPALLQKKGALLHAGMLGIFSALVLSPCLTPPLFAVLAQIAQTGDMTYGASRLFALGLGINPPLALLVLCGRSILPPSGVWMQHIKVLIGLILIGMAGNMLINISFPTYTWLIPTSLGILYSLYLSRQQRPLLALLLILTTFGTLALKKPYQAHEALHRHTSVAYRAAFDESVKKAEGQRIMVYVHADWCSSCKKLAGTTLQDPQILTDLKDVTVISVDVSEFNANTQALLNDLNVSAPPMLIVFDGQDVTQGEYLPGVTGVQTLHRALTR